MHRASSVELYGGPLDGERRVVPDTQHELTGVDADLPPARPETGPLPQPAAQVREAA
ncbi:hypothetical protein SEA_MELSMEOW_42 [Mycobacterium phage MelsMeow]|nr:hypothetical protein SEA_MELSMEOW_42 [Mycobacterium phage MelsMeow]